MADGSVEHVNNVILRLGGHGRGTALEVTTDQRHVAAQRRRVARIEKKKRRRNEE